MISSIVLINIFNMKTLVLSDSTLRHSPLYLVALPLFFICTSGYTTVFCLCFSFLQINVKYFYIAAYSKKSLGEYQCSMYVIRYFLRKVLKLINLGNNIIITLENSHACSYNKGSEIPYSKNIYLNFFNEIFSEII